MPPNVPRPSQRPPRVSLPPTPVTGARAKPASVASIAKAPVVPALPPTGSPRAFFVRQEGKRSRTPVTLDALAQMIRERKVLPHAMVAEVGTEAWHPLADDAHLAEALTAAYPPPAAPHAAPRLLYVLTPELEPGRPRTADEVRRAIAARKIPWSALVCEAGGTAWTPALSDSDLEDAVLACHPPPPPTTMLLQNEYWYVRGEGGDEVGILSTEEVLEGIANKAIGPLDQVARIGEEAWSPLSAVKELRDRMLAAYPPPPENDPEPRYYVRVGSGRIKGPFSLGSIRDAIANRKVGPSATMCLVGEDRWIALIDHPELRALVRMVYPPRPDRSEPALEDLDPTLELRAQGQDPPTDEHPAMAEEMASRHVPTIPPSAPLAQARPTPPGWVLWVALALAAVALLVAVFR
jgi:hypothetical protein